MKRSNLPSRGGAPQDDGGRTVIARSPCDEAIQPFEDPRSGRLDCFAYRSARRAARRLAMTQTRQRNGSISEGELDIANAKAVDPNIVKEFADYGVR
jgi:hypothetical protein